MFILNIRYEILWMQDRRWILAYPVCHLHRPDLGSIIHNETSWLLSVSLNSDGRSGGLVYSSPRDSR